MKISQRQLIHLSHVSRERFEDRCNAHFAEAMRAHDVGTTPAQIKEFVRRAIMSANKFGITQERDIAEYMEILIFVGPRRWRATEFIWIGEILENGSRPGGDRLRDVVERLRFGGDSSYGQ